MFYMASFAGDAASLVFLLARSRYELRCIYVILALAELEVYADGIISSCIMVDKWMGLVGQVFPVDHECDMSKGRSNQFFSK
jgi:hypothetical protein